MIKVEIHEEKAALRLSSGQWDGVVRVYVTADSRAEMLRFLERFEEHMKEAAKEAAAEPKTQGAGGTT